MPSCCFTVHFPLCHDWPVIPLQLTLDVGEDGPVIWGWKGNGNNNIQTMLFCYKKSRKLAVTFLHPHAIMVLPYAASPMPWSACNSLETHLRYYWGWPCNMGTKGRQQQQHLDGVSLLQKSRNLAVIFLHPHAIMLLPNAFPPMPWLA